MSVLTVVVLEACADDISPGHDAAAGGRADRLCVEALKLDAVPGQPVHVRGGDLSCVVSDVVVPEVVYGRRQTARSDTGVRGAYRRLR